MKNTLKIPILSFVLLSIFALYFYQCTPARNLSENLILFDFENGIEPSYVLTEDATYKIIQNN